MDSSIATTGSRAGLSTTIICCICGMLLFLGLGSVVYLLIPDVSLATRDAAANLLLVDPSYIRPEPKEKYTYLFLVLATPFILTASVRLTRALTDVTVPLSPWPTYAGLIYGAYLAANDPYWAVFFSSAASKWTTWLSVFVLSASIIGVATVRAKTFSISFAVAIGSLALSLNLILISASWRWFNDISLFETEKYIGHYDAVAYSVSQVVNGSTCLADITPQYGCYSEFMAPALKLAGGSTLAISSLFTILQVIAVLALIYTCKRLISRPLLRISALIWLVPVLNRIWSPVDEPNFQTMPVRLIFPTLSLLAALRWMERQTIRRAAQLGVFAG
jgi:hypothetical protein